jgi:hypothetical protein
MKEWMETGELQFKHLDMRLLTRLEDEVGTNIERPLLERVVYPVCTRHILNVKLVFAV